MSLGDRFVDGTDVDWGGVGRAFSGSIFAGLFLAIIGFIDSVRALFVDLLDGFTEFSTSLITTAITPMGLGDIWSSSGSSLAGLGPIGFVIASAIVGISVWIGVSLLILISRRMIPG